MYVFWEQGITIRPDLAYVVNIVSRFTLNPGKQHWKVVKWVLWYLWETMRLGLAFQSLKIGNLKVLQGYFDADYAGDLDQWRFMTGFVFTVAKCIVTWKTELQDIVVLLTTEAEYLAAIEAPKEAFWLRWLVSIFGIMYNTVQAYCDS